MISEAPHDTSFDSNKHTLSVKSDAVDNEESAAHKTVDELFGTKMLENALSSRNSSSAKEAFDVDSDGLTGDQKPNKKDTQTNLRELCVGIANLLITAAGFGLGLLSSVTTLPAQAENAYIYSNQQDPYKPKNENSKIAVYEIDSELINKLKNATETDILNRVPSEIKGSFANESFSLTKEELLDSLSALERVIFVYRDYENDPIGESEDPVDAVDAERKKKERRRRECELEENNTAQPL